MIRLYIVRVTYISDYDYNFREKTSYELTPAESFETALTNVINAYGRDNIINLQIEEISDGYGEPCLTISAKLANALIHNDPDSEED